MKLAVVLVFGCLSGLLIGGLVGREATRGPDADRSQMVAFGVGSQRPAWRCQPAHRPSE